MTMADNEVDLNSLSTSLAEQLTSNFYRWERRGRGWQIWDYPVEIEPPYEPFVSHYLPFRPAVDDSRTPTFWGSLLERVWKRFKGSLEKEQEDTYSLLPRSDFEPEPSGFGDPSGLKQISLSLPPSQRVSFENAEHFLLNLRYCALPVSFETIGSAESTSVQLVCREPDLLQVKQQLSAYFPDIFLYDEDETLTGLWDYDKQSMIVDFGLSQELTRPLRTFKSFDSDSCPALSKPWRTSTHSNSVSSGRGARSG